MKVSYLELGAKCSQDDDCKTGRCPDKVCRRNDGSCDVKLGVSDMVYNINPDCQIDQRNCSHWLPTRVTIRSSLASISCCNVANCAVSSRETSPRRTSSFLACTTAAIYYNSKLKKFKSSNANLFWTFQTRS